MKSPRTEVMFVLCVGERERGRRGHSRWKEKSSLSNGTGRSCYVSEEENGL